MIEQLELLKQLNKRNRRSKTEELERYRCVKHMNFLLKISQCALKHTIQCCNTFYFYTCRKKFNFVKVTAVCIIFFLGGYPVSYQICALCLPCEISFLFPLSLHSVDYSEISNNGLWDTDNLCYRQTTSPDWLTIASEIHKNSGQWTKGVLPNNCKLYRITSNSWRRSRPQEFSNFNNLIPSGKSAIVFYYFLLHLGLVLNVSA